jgi:hypothetical protein
MPVAVNIPIRIKVDPVALWMRPRCIEDALSKAVARALSKSSTEVLDPRGGYPAVRLHAPEIRWSGDGLDHITPAQRVATRELVSSVLERAVESAGLLSRLEGRRPVPTPMPQDPSERIDPDRHAALLGRYVIPSYDGARRKVAVKAETAKRKGRAVQTEDSTTVTVFDLIDPNWTDVERAFKFFEEATIYLTDHGRLPVSQPRVMGLLGAHPRGGYQILFFQVANPGKFEVEYDAGRGMFAPNVTYLTASPPFNLPDFAFVAGPQGVQINNKSTPLPIGKDYLLRWVPANTTGSARANIERHLRTGLLEMLTADRAKLAILSDPEFKLFAEQVITSQIAAFFNDPGIKSFMLLTGGGERRFGGADFDVPAGLGDDIVVVLPLLAVVQQKKAKKKAKTAAVRAAAQRRAKTGAGGAAAAAAAAAIAAEDGAARAVAGGSGTMPFGPEGPQGELTPPPFDPNAPDVECENDFKYSALNPEGYLEDSDHLKCRPLLGEPALSQLGPLAKDLQSRIARITAELGLPATCGAYGGSFCLGVGQEIARRARRIGENAAYESATAGTLKSSREGNLGFVQFDPESTPAIKELQRLAGLLDDVMELGDRMQGLYRWWWPNLCGRWYEYSSQWGLAFHVLFHPIKTEAVGNLFKAACRVLLLQLLEASRSQIQARKNKLATYGPIFEFLLRAHFTDKAELEALKARLQLASIPFLAAPPGAAVSWLQLSTSLLEEIDKGNVASSTGLTIKDGLVYKGETLAGIQDEQGNVWTKESLEQALAQREFLIESIDPMIKQFSDDEAKFILGLLDENPTFQLNLKVGFGGPMPKLGDIEKAILGRVIGANKISTEIVVGAVLDEMLAKNAGQARKTRESFDYAYGSAPLKKGLQADVPYLNFDLQGIHKLANEQIRPAFKWHPERYGWELDDVLASRAGAESLTFFFKAVGVAVLSVVCPPLGIAVGAALAIQDHQKALEKKALFRSLIDPDQVITRAEVEAELFAAELGLVLSFLPHGKTILGGAAKGIRVFSERGLRHSARAAVDQTRRALTGESAKAAAAALRQRFGRQMAEALKDDFAVALTKELAIDQFMDLFLGKLLLEPLVNSIYDDFKGYSSEARGPGLVTQTFDQETE